MESIYEGGRRPFRVIAVTSGKGGVGKTNLAVNLSVAFAQDGRDVLLMDGDLGLANVDILLDESPVHTMADVLGGELGLADVLVSSSHGVTVLPGTSGIAEMASLGPVEQARFLEEADALGDRFDTVVIDTEAGIGPNARFFASAAQEVLLVTTPEPTALADAYGMLKVLVSRSGLRQVGLVVNQASSKAEARDVFARLHGISSRFLPVVMDLIGFVPYDYAVRVAVMERKPLLAEQSMSAAGRAIRDIADRLLLRPVPETASGRIQFFWQRLIDAAEPTQL